MKQIYILLMLVLILFTIEKIQAQVRILPDSIGVGTESPESAVHVLGEGDIADNIIIESRNNVNSLAGSLLFHRTSGTLISPLAVRKDNSLGIISWKGFTGTSGDYATAAQIEAQTASKFATSSQGRLLFKTNNGSSIIERMRIEDDGNVGIGTTSPDELLHVEGGTKIVGKVDISASADALASMYIGKFAGQSDTVMDERSNVGVGFNALRDNLTGENNTALGISTQLQNESGDNNTSLGYFALSNNVEGNNNTVIGSNAVGFASFSSANTVIGAEIMRLSSTGSFNTAVGFQSMLDNTTGDSNSAIGLLSLQNNTTGKFNTALGNNALETNTIGSSNTAVGFLADVSSNNLTNATAIGANAVVSTSNSLVLGNDANVGIGTSSPDAKLDIEFASSQSDPHLMLTETAQNAPARITFRNTNVFSGNAFWNLTGNAASPAFAIFYSDGTTGNTFIRIDPSTSDIEFNSDVIPTNAASNFDLGNNTSLEHWDDCVADDFINFSDKRLKRDISSLTEVLPGLMKLNPVTYKYKPQHNADGRQRTGFIAQDVQKVFPQVVVDKDIDIDAFTKKPIEITADFLSMNYIELIPITIKAIQEQQKIIEERGAQIADLELLNKELQGRLSKIESLLFGKTSNENNNPNNSIISNAKLYSNHPNPFTERTILRYFIPNQVQQTALRITDSNGKVIKIIPINTHGEGQTTLEAKALSAGNYFYSLILDGKVFETKQMVLVE